MIGYYHLRQAVFSYGEDVNNILKNRYINGLLNIAEHQRKNFAAEADYVADEISFWFNSLIIVGVVCAVAAMLINWLSLLCVFRHYRRHLIHMYQGRMGEFPSIFQSSPDALLALAVRYIPYQLAYAIIGMIVQLVTLTVFTLVVYVLVVALFIRYDVLPESATTAQVV